MGAALASLMKDEIRKSLLSKLDPNNLGHPLYCKKTIVNGTLTFSDDMLTDNMEDIVQLISEGICNYLTNTWMPSVVVSGNAAVTTAPGVAKVTGVIL